MVTEFIRKKKWKQFDPNNRAGYWNIVNQREANIRMFCLSAVNADILMWSHYAQNHHGICLGFDIGSNPFFEKTTRVRYANKYPRVDYYRVSDQKYYEYSLLTKSDRWKYEKEWRFLWTNAAGLKDPVHHFDALFLKTVIFGCQTTDSDKDLIMEWLSAGGLRPTLYYAHSSETEYELNIVHSTKA